MNFKIKIENVVASASLGVPVKLEKLVANLDGVEYEPEQFPGLVMRLKNPKAAALSFRLVKWYAQEQNLQKRQK